MAHHVPENLLLAYTSGAAPEAVALAVAGHVALCASCRDRVAIQEQVGGALLEAVEPVELDPGALDAMLARLDELAPVDTAVARLPTFLADLPVPRPLHHYLQDATGWQRVLPGIRAVPLPLELDGTPVHLMALRAGLTIPEHGHEGLELNLVLTGGFDDKQERAAYLPGDLSVKSQETVHTIRVHDDEDCIVLVVRGGKLLPRDMVGRIAQWLTGF